MWPLLPGMTWEAQEKLSTWFGYASILAWLCAQAPQVLENYRNKSVEAIALPFLVSWFFGDFTNLIGCVLTHQLPFQTYLATYFVLIDVMLMAQFFHYSRANPSTSIPPLSIDYPYAQAPHTHHHHHHHRESQSSVRRSRSFHRSSSQQHSATPSRRRVKTLAVEDGQEPGETDLEDPMTSSWMSQSSNATTPARSLRNGRTSTSPPKVIVPRASRTSTTTSILTNPTPQALSISTSQVLSAPSTSTSSSGPSSSSVEIPTMASSTASITSIASASEARGRTMTRNYDPHHYLHHYHHPSSLETISGSPASGPPAPLMRSLMDLEQQARERAQEAGQGRGDFDDEGDERTERGRSPHRADLPSNVLPQYVREATSRHNHSSSSHHHHHQQQPGSGRSSSRSRPPPPARRTSSMLFLSVGLFFTFTTLGRRAGKDVGSFEGGAEGSGRAWEVGLPKLDWVQEPTMQLGKRQTFPLDVSVASSPSKTTIAIGSSGGKSDDHIAMGHVAYLVNPQVARGRDWQRFIGRTSAWTCTTLYLTSRLPQIWQNVSSPSSSCSTPMLSAETSLTAFSPKFRRRSVAGLSIILFIMAFVGNTLYVISILLNPLATESVGYLLESTPYLLGSGGTLCFDVTIVFQSWLYSESRKRRKGVRRGLGRGDSSGLRGREEEEGLLGTTEEEEGVEGGRRRSSSRRIGSSKRSTSSKRGWARASASLDRSDPAFKVSRSVSVSSQRTSRAPSVRTFATDGAEGDSTIMDPPSARWSRAERGVLDDLEFEFEPTRSNTSSRGPSPNRSRKDHPSSGHSGHSGSSGMPSRSRSTSRTRSRTTSDNRTSSLGVVPEAGESHLTIKG
ncbi:BQ2448_5649 [Microbotryum intermedium]|uniref:BQ2448_5649 protein n=1 Tax=Microbotryum intermedium TaxID=269621 RepID=A0A238F563_9BASI|nr:BQ2448_5649 [Microbotryum intermedium]